MNYQAIADAIKGSQLPLHEALDIAVELFSLTRYDYLAIIRLLMEN